MWQRQAGALAAFAVLTLGAAWYVWSPRWALEAVQKFGQPPETIARLYDRDAVRAAFARQTSPIVDDYPPPFTRKVILDSLSDPRAVRMLMVEPYGEWQFAASEGLPPDLLPDDTGPMPRLLETTQERNIDRHGLSGFTATGADRPGGNRYVFRREGFGWTLKAIELTETIR